ncbi:MAG: hypothetical protein IMZ61_06970 [Planctomycetes bacterium]|nr:hypothetical protein [Planctomycetota bacterium]
MTKPPLHKGNWPTNVSKDAKYCVRNVDGKSQVAIIYETDDNEIWHAATDSHPKLVQLVNQAKISICGKPHGSFYINEFQQVILSAVGSPEYYLVVEYQEPLRFEFEGKIISGEPLDFSRKHLKAGDIWFGPHAGIPYILVAGGDDIHYEYSPRPNVTKKVRLSDIVGKERAVKIANLIREVKGFAGGRFYVNEFQSMFAPVNSGSLWKYLYISQLDRKNWFPKPL